MPGANAKWRAAVKRASKPASRRPKSGTQVTQHAETAIGGGTNAVAGRLIPNSTSQGRRISGRGVI